MKQTMNSDMNDMQELLEKIVKPEIRELLRIKDTSDDRYEYLRFEKNERLFPFNEKLFEEFRKSIRSDHISGYYELGNTYRKLAVALGVDVNQIFYASGSDLAIKSVYEACVGRGDHVVLPSPAYAMNMVYSNMFGASASTASINENWQFDVDEMLSKVNDRTKLMVIENPNGTVGTSPDFEDLRKCASYLCRKNVLFLIDEAYHYIEEHEFRTASLIKDYRNVIISQSLSKAPGIAGVRVGYLVSNSRLMEYISRVRPMHEIGSLAAMTAEWILSNRELLDEYRSGLRKSKDFLGRKFSELKIRFKDTKTNFILVYMPDEGNTKNISGILREKFKIIIRRPFEGKYLKGWIRITVGTLEESGKLIEAIKSCIMGK